ncbi:hypothetical protein [Streptomyces radiopugnans]|uniref:hypothetical protein n=1 Tax=Streptomyces radiopugnans TaxID=403935 RepID=UPI000B825B00|nr:hypothetical protein [Streptomyces radiopugnans]
MAAILRPAPGFLNSFRPCFPADVVIAVPVGARERGVAVEWLVGFLTGVMVLLVLAVVVPARRDGRRAAGGRRGGSSGGGDAGWWGDGGSDGGSGGGD